MPEVKKKKQVTEFGEMGKHVVDEVKKMMAEGFKRSPWHSISVYPTKTRFESQTDREHVLLLMRKHMVTNLWWIVVSVMLVGVPLFWGEFPFISAVSPVVQFSLAVLWYVGLAFFVILNVLLWFYNVYIVTDERVVDVDFFGLLYKNINATQIRKIEDVNYSQVGLLSSFFNFGNVVIQTASAQKSDDVPGEASAFTFEAVPNPDRVVRVIAELMEQEEQEEYEGRVR